MSTIRIAGCSLTGARSHNEDVVRHGSTPQGHFAVVADGAGGHRRGAEAARRSADCMERLLRDGGMEFCPASLTAMVRQAHRVVLAHQDASAAEHRMHSTVVTLWIDAAGDHALWTHVGDSRLYRIRQQRIDVVTSDDSVVQRMVRLGLISIEQAAHHPQKNQLVAALGIDGEVEPHTVVRPVEVQEGDAFLLCTDGWWEGLDDETLRSTLVRALTPQDWLDAMRGMIEARQRPRQDNFSAVAIWAGDPGEVTQAGGDDTMPRGAFLR
jgi:serine/threonine protein phosphatase PrpC